jgi:branched-chain amino acid transport system permease protein
MASRRRARLDQWHALPPLTRRVAIAAALIVILFAVSGFAGSAILLGLAFAALYVPPFDRVPLGRFAVPLGVLVLAVTYPYWRPHMFEFVIFGPFPSMDTATIAVVFAMMAVGLNIVVGYAGLLDLGYVAFYAMGAYTVAWFASPQFAGTDVSFGAVGVPPDIPGIHVSVWLLLILAGIFTAVIGVLIGLPTLRLRGDYLAIVTLGFGEIMPQVARNGDDLFGTGFNLTGGPPGITPIDAPGFGVWASENLHLPETYITSPNFDKLYFWTGVVLLLFTIFCSARLRDSRLGRAWIAIREDEIAAAAMGVPLMRTKTWAYAAGAFFGGIAGAYYASYKTATFPDDFFFNISIFILCMVILGGMGNIWGVLLGAVFLSYLDREGLANLGGWLNTRFTGDDATWVTVKDNPIDVPLYSFGIYGLVILIVMLFRPEGLLPSLRQKRELHEGVHDQPLYDAQA